MTEHFPKSDFEIMVMDQEPKCRLMPGLIVRPFGFTVRETDSVKGAMLMLKKYPIRVIFLGSGGGDRNHFVAHLKSAVPYEVVTVLYGDEVPESGMDFEYRVQRPPVSTELLGTIEAISSRLKH